MNNSVNLKKDTFILWYHCLFVNEPQAGSRPPGREPFPPDLVWPGRQKLTKNGKRLILKPMKIRLLRGAGPVLVVLFLGASPLQETNPPLPPRSSDLPVAPQQYPASKPKSDYMSQILGRNTKPLGLKEDLALRRLVRQPAIKWAIRTGQRHILD
jgi:hypothetical protein